MSPSRGTRAPSRLGFPSALSLIGWVSIAILFEQKVYGITVITGPSMQPTLNPNLSSAPLHHDVVLLERWSVALERLRRFRRGDVVTMWAPFKPDLLTVKRIVALEGDVVSAAELSRIFEDIIHPFVARFGHRPEVPKDREANAQVTPLPPAPPTPMRIPPGHCWVEGDSRHTKETRDSNLYGPVPLGLISARVALILWPWSRRGGIDGSEKAKGRVKRARNLVEWRG